MSLVASKPADEVREMWQSRALLASDGKLRKVLITALAKEYPAAMVTLMKVSFPGFVDFDRPFFLSYAAIAPSGRIVCDMMDRDGSVRKVSVYRNENLFLYDMRKLADRLKLADRERTEMFAVLQKWVASDQRINVMGERLAS